jgi:serine/threonine protein kinase
MLDKLPCNASEMLHNRYRLIRKIAQNGARRALLAQDQQDGKLVVIKVLLFSEEFRWEDLKLFEREAETLKHLEHPAIPRYIDYFELDTPQLRGFALVQTYIEAKSLQEYVEAGRNFSESEIIQLAKSLLGILHYLHSRHPAVIHRDIKPSNILLNNTSGNSVGDVYLVDFGAVQTKAKVKGTRTVVGTYGYMPPEQFGGRAFPTSDLYSLGMTLIYLATRNHPSELLDDNLSIHCDKIPNLSIKFKTWLSILIQPSTNRRFDSVTAALHALDNLSQLSDEYNLSYKDNNSSKLKKPLYSKIKINRSKDKLQIRLPAKTPSQVIGNIFSAIFPTAFILLIFSYPIMMSLNFLIGVLVHELILRYIAIFLGISLALYITSCILVNLFGQKTLFADKKCLVIATELFGSQIFTGATRTIIAREYIWKLVVSAQKYKLLNLENKLETTQKSPTIIIWYGKSSQYDLNTLLHQPLKVEERDWLAQELSDFLDIPLVKE